MGSTWRGRLAAALCISERILFLPLVPDTMDKCALARPASSCSCVPSAPWTSAHSLRRADLFLGRHPQLLLTGLSLPHGKFCFPELAWDQAREQLSQSLALSRYGEHHLLGHFLKLLWDSNGIPESIWGSSLAPWCHRERQLI